MVDPCSRQFNLNVTRRGKILPRILCSLRTCFKESKGPPLKKLQRAIQECGFISSFLLVIEVCLNAGTYLHRKYSMRQNIHTLELDSPQGESLSYHCYLCKPRQVLHLQLPWFAQPQTGKASNTPSQLSPLLDRRLCTESGIAWHFLRRHFLATLGKKCNLHMLSPAALATNAVLVKTYLYTTFYFW